MKHQELIEDINACEVPFGQVAFWWIGQHSFVVKLGKNILYFDPFLTDLSGRKISPQLSAEEITNATLIFGSHDHADHMDRPAWPSLAQHSPQSRFIVPELFRTRLSHELEISEDRFLGLDDGQTLTHGDLTITAIAAAHEQLAPDPKTGQHPTLGFIVQGNGVTVYHSGDTCLYEGMQTKLSQHKIDLAFLPINGRDAKRLKAGCIGNMTYQEAVDLAGALKPNLTLPSHFEMFEGNTEDPQLFIDYMTVKYPALKTFIPEHGKRFLLTR